MESSLKKWITGTLKLPRDSVGSSPGNSMNAKAIEVEDLI